MANQILEFVSCFVMTCFIVFINWSHAERSQGRKIEQFSSETNFQNHPIMKLTCRKRTRPTGLFRPRWITILFAVYSCGNWIEIVPRSLKSNNVDWTASSNWVMLAGYTQTTNNYVTIRKKAIIFFDQNNDWLGECRDTVAGNSK